MSPAVSTSRPRVWRADAAALSPHQDQDQHRHYTHPPTLLSGMILNTKIRMLVCKTIMKGVFLPCQNIVSCDRMELSACLETGDVT